MNLEEALKDIKSHIPLKDVTCIGDIILVGTPGGIFYATVQGISPDVKKNWYTVRFTLLVLPPVCRAWTLRPPQMCGELFTINGEQHFMAAVELANNPAGHAESPRDCTDAPGRTGKVLQLIPRNDRDLA